MRRVTIMVAAALAAAAPGRLLAQSSGAPQLPRSPCPTDPGFRQFDFWLGDWDVVRSDNARAAGRSHVELILGQCVVFENWMALSGGQGKSFNTYSPATGQWHQEWVDMFGTRRDFDGSYEGNAMRLATETDSAGRASRITWYNFAPDSVRQVGETSQDRGRTWTLQYDFMYHKARTP